MIWNGVYRSFEDAQSENSAFVHPNWVQRSVERLREVSLDREPNSATTTVDGSLLIGPILATLENGTSVKILDVGGNLGQLAIEINRKFTGTRISWTILEREDFLKASQQFINLPEDLEFHSDLESLKSQTFDIIHFGSSIQYIDDWVDYVSTLSQKHLPKWFVIADGMSGETIPTFVTRQKYYEGYLVSRFVNLSELISVFDGLDFNLVYQSPFVNESNRGYYPEQDLPDEYRINFPLDLIFRARER